jgi:RNA polymerase sigma-70 factor, ECF subfamily
MALAATVAGWSKTEVPSDEEIVRRVVGGEPALFEVLMRRNNQRLYRAVRSVVRTESDAEEVMQQSYVQAYAALGGFAHSAKFSTWLIRIGLNAALSSKRRDARFASNETSPLSSEENALERLPSPLPTPEDKASTRELSQLLERVLDALPQGYRTVLMLREVEGLSTSEAALALGVSDDVVKTRLHRAKLLAKETLHAWAEEHAKHAFEFHASRCDRVVAAVLQRVLDGTDKN